MPRREIIFPASPIFQRDRVEKCASYYVHHIRFGYANVFDGAATFSILHDRSENWKLSSHVARERNKRRIFGKEEDAK